MKIKSIVKYNIGSLKKSILIYYCVFIAICALSTIFAYKFNGTISSSGIELSSAIFIFVVGLNVFKENFYFIKANNLSRKSYFYGTVLSMVPISIGMSFIDLILNRIYNIFVNCPTNYDMIYTDYVNIWNYANNGWVQSNSLETLFNTFLFQVSVYLMVFLLWFLITMLYYKCNKLMKTVISIIPILLIIVFNMIFNMMVLSFPYLLGKISEALFYILGILPRNVYMTISTFSITSVALAAVAYLLIRKMTIKQKDRRNIKENAFSCLFHNTTEEI